MLLSFESTLRMNLVFIVNHTAVWGSWYDPSTSSWGYACCHSTIHASYCAGEAGIEAARASSARDILAAAVSTTTKNLTEANASQRDESSDGREKKAQNPFKRNLGEGDVVFDKTRLAQAINDEKKRKMRGEDDEERWGTKKPKAFEEDGRDVTEEDLGMFSPCSRLNSYSLCL
jgi:pre-mRNA-processing factor SLU7